MQSPIEEWPKPYQGKNFIIDGEKKGSILIFTIGEDGKPSDTGCAYSGVGDSKYWEPIPLTAALMN